MTIVNLGQAPILHGCMSLTNCIALLRTQYDFTHALSSMILLMAFGCAQVPGPAFPSLESRDSRPSCDCYYTLDCQSPAFTPDAQSTMFICERNWHESSVCDEDNFESSAKYLDGLCQTIAISPAHAEDAIDALDGWLQAYESAGRVGGPPDPHLIRAAQHPNLTAREQNAIRSLVFHILSLTLGLTSYPDGIPHAPGFFTMPPSKRQTDDPGASDAQGQVSRLPDTYRGALGLIREGLIGELTDPAAHSLQKTFATIRGRFPRYRPFARCEHPHPPSHGHLFPYADGIACLEEELRVVVFSLRPVNH